MVKRSKSDARSDEPQLVELAGVRHEIEFRDPRQLKPHPQNSRHHSDVQIAQLEAALRRFGITKPILVDEDDTILAGHATTQAAMRVGMVRVPVVVARGWDDQQKRAYLIADNRLGEKSRWDATLLALEIDTLRSLGDDLQSLGFSELDVAQALKRGAAPDADAAKAQLGDGLMYRVIVDCTSEQHQTELLVRFEQEGITCRALIS